MDDVPTSFLSPRLEGRPVNGGRGVFARERIEKGDVIAVWGGEVAERASFDLLPESTRRISVQVEDHLFLVPNQEGPAEWFNHSCCPNAGMQGQITLVALRDILAGEEVCYDYAMSDGSPYDEFACFCGTPFCRKHITGNDWQLPELWSRYEGHFSPYLERRILQLRSNTRAYGLENIPVTNGNDEEAVQHPLNGCTNDRMV